MLLIVAHTRPRSVEGRRTGGSFHRYPEYRARGAGKAACQVHRVAAAVGEPRHNGKGKPSIVPGAAEERRRVAQLVYR